VTPGVLILAFLDVILTSVFPIVFADVCDGKDWRSFLGDQVVQQGIGETLQVEFELGIPKAPADLPGIPNREHTGGVSFVADAC